MDRKVVIITGGGSGIGRGMAEKYVQEGWNVVIAGRTLEKLEQTKRDIEQFGGQVLTVQMDVRDPEMAERMVKETKEAFGRIDVLINNAAGNFIVNAEDLTVNGWKAVVEIVLYGTWFCSQAVAKDWIRDEKVGSIINIVAPWPGGAPGVVHSASAKAGVQAMSKTLAVEWGKKYSIRVNCIAPGGIDGTEGVDKLYPSEKSYQDAVDKVPLKRFGKLEEVASLAYFLSSDNAGYINGECIYLDAGEHLVQIDYLSHLENINIGK
ncbi:2,4-dienoyl-CoA reductase [Oceanobacillus sp. CF4.6]|uniref:2,4-dienoyl-CoA reductase n=1 Tax=Oceanobacillus sp. CF4.6 TaxID=3373080 RepID=UPI003EE6BE37